MVIFVVQKHNATHLHYDFRLQIGNVLKSWAVPKEPPLKPNIKRLAVQVEDHALSYASFEGTIPKGMYGAGTVKIWDKGDYELLSKTKDKIEFILHGKKMNGKYALIRFKNQKKNWILIKTKEQKRSKNE